MNLILNSRVDWSSTDHFSLLNPRFSESQKSELFGMIRKGIPSDLDPSVFILSSGTTAASDFDLKWIALSKSALLVSAEAVNLHLQSDASDVWIHCLPEFHVGGLGIWARAYLSGARVILLPKWEVSEFVTQIQRYQATLSSLVPAQVYDLVQAETACPASMRAIAVGGGALSEVLYQKARKLRWPLLPTYGMTEAGSQIATAGLQTIQFNERIESETRGCEGLPRLMVLPHLEVREGIESRLEFRGKSLFSGSIGRRGKEIVFEDPKNEGWFTSLDRGRVCDHSLQILGRTSDFVKVGGESVEMGRLRGLLEEARLKLGVIADVVLLSVPDERLGQVIHLISDRTLQEDLGGNLIQAFNKLVFGFERIRKWHKVDAIPRTSLGKLISAALLREIVGSNSP